VRAWHGYLCARRVRGRGVRVRPRPCVKERLPPRRHCPAAANAAKCHRRRSRSSGFLHQGNCFGICGIMHTRLLCCQALNPASVVTPRSGQFAAEPQMVVWLAWLCCKFGYGLRASETPLYSRHQAGWRLSLSPRRATDSASALAPRPKARSTMRASPRISCVRLKIAAPGPCVAHASPQSHGGRIGGLQRLETPHWTD
jgi:hypothetical protein